MKLDREQLKTKIEAHLLSYVALRSDTGTIHERNIEKFYTKWFNDVPYFKENPDHCGIFPIPNDKFERHVPWALLKGKGLQGESQDTIVLLHHSDTVDRADYLTISDLALNPTALEEAFKAGKLALPQDAKADLDSGEWLFGRGVNDMKGGAAIHIAMLEEYTKIRNFKGNLLLLAVPDEENLSAGAIGAAHLLCELADKHNLNYKLCLMGEPDTTEGSFHDGSIGKIMPLIHVRGQLAHVGKVYDGLSPVKILAKIIDELELNPNFIESDGQITTPPPAFLYARDQKDVYDVSLPATASGFISIFCFIRTPRELMELVKTICEEAMADSIASFERSYAKFAEIQNIGNDNPSYNRSYKTNVKLYSELYDEAVRDSGQRFLSEIEKTKSEIAEKVKASELTYTQGTQAIIDRTLDFVADRSPIVVITLIPPYYPCVANEKLLGKNNEIDALCDDLINYAKETDAHNFQRNLANYMCDFSYMMQTDDKQTNDYIQSNMLMWGENYQIPFEKIRKNSMPLLNIGPRGRGVHQYTERVLKSDLYYRIPRYVEFVIERVLGK